MCTFKEGDTFAASYMKMFMYDPLLASLQWSLLLLVANAHEGLITCTPPCTMVFPHQVHLTSGSNLPSSPILLQTTSLDVPPPLKSSQRFSVPRPTSVHTPHHPQPLKP